MAEISVRDRNQQITSWLTSGDQVLQKRGEDALQSFTRTTLREDSFAYKIIEPLDIPDEELTPQVTTDKPAKVLEMEPGSPAAVSVPFGQLPTGIYIYAPRYLATFDRILSPRVLKDVSELKTYDMDVRKVLSDNMTKDMLAEVDSKFLTAVERALVGVDVTHPINQIKSWQTVSGGITRETTIYATHEIMPTSPFRLAVHTCLVNVLFLAQLMKFGRDEMGGDFSEQVLLNGWTDRTYAGKRWVATIKRDLVPDNRLYGFADPRAIGKLFVMEQPTLFVKKEAFLLDYFLYMTIGGAIGNTAGLIIADFDA